MLKRLAYLIAGSALILLVAAVFWGFNRLNALTLAQQQTQRQITQWREQPQPDSDYRDLEVAVKNITGRTEALARQLNDAASTQAERLHPINEQIKALERQLQTLTPATTDRHAQPRKGKKPHPISALGRKGPFFSYCQRVSRRAAVRRHCSIRISLALTASACGPRRQRAGLAIAATGRQSRYFP